MPSPSPYSLDFTKIPPVPCALSSTSNKGAIIPPLNHSPPYRSPALPLSLLEYFPLPHSHNTPSASDSVNTSLSKVSPLNRAKVKFKPEPASSPDTHTVRVVIKLPGRSHEHRTRSPIEPILAENTPGAETQHELSDSEPDSDYKADETGEADEPDKPPPYRHVCTQFALLKGNLECYAKTIAEYCSTVPIPRTTSSSRRDQSEKRFISSPTRNLDSYGSIETTLNVSMGKHMSILMSTLVFISVRTQLQIPTKGSGTGAQRKFLMFHLLRRAQSVKSIVGCISS
ncbi:hypothetical protein B9Z19DRAFT_1064794 [Tuber borchii]|uniref:Uncharacterized protein n=1 Tax=Tuber borchii TaxID=42251 RepID=A0A2T6ZTH2_TUBBO|nr:hypothetical protein B9Z19DRAFT_1064794 [Tuber borchii]